MLPPYGSSGLPRRVRRLGSVGGAVRSHNRLVEAIRHLDASAAAAEAVSHFRWYRSYIERRYPTLLERLVRWTPT